MTHLRRPSIETLLTVTFVVIGVLWVGFLGGQHLAGRDKIEVVDLLQNPKLARDVQIVAIPTLVRKLPDPIRKIVGDLSDTERALVGLQLRRSKE